MYFQAGETATLGPGYSIYLRSIQREIIATGARTEALPLKSHSRGFAHWRKSQRYAQYQDAIEQGRAPPQKPKTGLEMLPGGEMRDTQPSDEPRAEMDRALVWASLRVLFSQQMSGARGRVRSSAYQCAKQKSTQKQIKHAELAQSI